MELSLGRQFPRLGAIAVVGQVRRFSWDQPGKEKRQKFAKVSIGFRSIVDTRDAISFPEVGKYHVVDLEFAGNLYNEKSAYTRFFTSLEAYYRLSKRLNLHPRAALGASSDFMPYFDEFSLGGQHNFLGLHEDEFLGDKMVLGNLEMRYRLLDRVYLMAAYNGGNIWDQLERVRLSKLRHGGGIGIGIRTPLGPIEGWYGRTSKGLGAFYLHVGHDW
jgi:outer membrane protein insertion porin family